MKTLPLYPEATTPPLGPCWYLVTSVRARKKYIVANAKLKSPYFGTPSFLENMHSEGINEAGDAIELTQHLLPLHQLSTLPLVHMRPGHHHLLLLLFSRLSYLKWQPITALRTSFMSETPFFFIFKYPPSVYFWVIWWLCIHPLTSWHFSAWVQLLTRTHLGQELSDERPRDGRCFQVEQDRRNG